MIFAAEQSAMFRFVNIHRSFVQYLTSAEPSILQHSVQVFFKGPEGIGIQPLQGVFESHLVVQLASIGFAIILKHLDWS